MAGIAADRSRSKNIAAFPGSLSEPGGEAKGKHVFWAEVHCHPDLRVWVGDLPPAVIDYAFIAALAKGRVPHFVTYSFRELHPPEATAQKVLDLPLARVDELSIRRQFAKPRHRGNRILSVRNRCTVPSRSMRSAYPRAGATCRYVAYRLRSQRSCRNSNKSVRMSPHNQTLNHPQLNSLTSNLRNLLFSRIVRLVFSSIPPGTFARISTVTSTSASSSNWR